MAKLLPDSPGMDVTPAVARLRRALKALPDEAFTVWQRLPIHTDAGPDFLVLRSDRRAAWIKAADLGPADARALAQSSLFDAEHPCSPLSACREVSRFIEAQRQNLAPLDLAAVPAVVIFPNLTERDLSQLARSVSPPAGFTWHGREALPAFGDLLVERLGRTLTEDEATGLRRAFTPEVVIPAQFTVRASQKRNNQAQLTDSLLDYDQEHILKTDLLLSAAADAAVGDFNLRLVNGVAGSGKSLILVYRAKLLRQFFPDKSILGLTHNRPLINDLSRRYRRLRGASDVTWLTFNQWCWKLYAKACPGSQRVQMISIGCKERLVLDIQRRLLADTQISDRMLREELDWCKDRLVFSVEDYVNADRAGRGFALSEPLRRRMWQAFVAYQQELDRMKLLDWGDMPRQVWRAAQAGRLQIPTHDVILIDEAQFFAPLWFELIKRAVAPQTGHLFMVADPTQGFLKRRQSWVACGLDVRGRSHRLRRSYRTTREILSFATLFYRGRVSEDGGDDIVMPDFEDMPHGANPEIVPVSSEQDEITRVVNEVSELVRRGVARAHILVIHADWGGQKEIIRRLDERFGPGTAFDPKEANHADGVRVCTLNAAGGIESPIVLLAGTGSLLEQEQSIRISDEERQDLVRDNSRMLYMAITRAGQRLMITVPDGQAEQFQVVGRAMARGAAGAAGAP